MPGKDICMQNLKSLSNEELDLKLGLFLKKENLLLKESILHIQEAERRRLYHQFGFRNLYEYLTEHHKYTEGSAQRRIDAARLAVFVPALIDYLALNEISLSQVTLMQKGFRQWQKKHKSKLSAEVKKELVENLRKKSEKDSQIILAQKLGMQIKASSKVSHQADESVRLAVTFSPSQWGKMVKMRELLSHSVPDGSWDEVMEYVADRVIKSKSPPPDGGRNRQKPSREQKAGKQQEQEQEHKPGNKPELNPESNSASNLESNPDSQPESQAKSSDSVSVSVAISHITSAIGSPMAATNPISLYKLRKIVLNRDQCCQAKDSKSGQVCGSRWQLQVDHIKPRWAGGEDKLENLQALCARHNRAKYREQANIR
jgi:hypothetical protein